MLLLACIHVLIELEESELDIDWMMYVCTNIFLIEFKNVSMHGFILIGCKFNAKTWFWLYLTPLQNRISTLGIGYNNEIDNKFRRCSPLGELSILTASMDTRRWLFL